MSCHLPMLMPAALLLAAAGCGGPSTEESSAGQPTPEQLAVARADLPKEKPPLLEQLDFSAALKLQRGVDETAADALGRIGPAAIPALQSALKDPDAQVRREAARAFARMGPPAEPALPDLIAALKDPDADVRRAAAQAIGQIGPAAASAIPALVDALRDHSEDSDSP